MKKNINQGWVYLLKCLPNFYKVGITKNSITQRLSNYKTHNPYKLRVIELIYVNDCRKLESEIHKKYFNFESDIKSDWFILDKTIADEIKQFMIIFQMENAVIPDYKKNLI